MVTHDARLQACAARLGDFGCYFPKINTWVLSDFSPGSKPFGLQMDLQKEDEEVYMYLPKGYVMPGNEHNVCKLVKSLCEVKQTPTQMVSYFDESDRNLKPDPSPCPSQKNLQLKSKPQTVRYGVKAWGRRHVNPYGSTLRFDLRCNALWHVTMSYSKLQRIIT
ncbi:hypothetical protein OSB04_023416 [Centaurea solstitialis]|uniref:Uncharacterized protein n=1 Tax=Centaurea solstitialis TaxID=347529 RepID=A0AA38WB23_9ASTR|nr:hypothetical protein OSB04_023416 [Centaurea solstitialis]